MKKRFAEEQLIGFLQEAEAGLPVKELCRKHGFSDASFYTWRTEFGGMAWSTVGYPPRPFAAFSRFDECVPCVI